MTAPQKPRLSDLMPPELARTFGVERGEAATRPLGIAALDEQLGGGIPPAALIEIAGTDAADWLAMRMLAAHAGPYAVVDSDNSFFPPGAAAQGVNLAKLLVVRETRRRQALWALERLSRDKNLQATVAWLPALTDTYVRRLQLAAEGSGQALVLLTEEPAKSSRWCALRLKVTPRPTTGAARQVVVEVLKMRGGATPRPVLIEVDDETGSVSGASVLPHGAADKALAAGPA